MSVKHALLALLGERPRHGYQLKTAFEARTGGTWPLNVGQVYTTLQRLERDGLVTAGQPAEDGTVTYGLTEAGRAEVATWWTSPVARQPPARDELAIKLALAVTLGGIDALDVVEQQRSATLRALQGLTRLKAKLAAGPENRPSPNGDGPPAVADTAWLLVLERLIFDADAEARWLDHVATTVRARALGRTAGPGSGS